MSQALRGSVFRGTPMRAVSRINAIRLATFGMKEGFAVFLGAVAVQKLFFSSDDHGHGHGHGHGDTQGHGGSGHGGDSHAAAPAAAAHAKR